MSSVRKKIDRVKIGDILLENTKIDFGEIDPHERVNGLIGLDFLRAARVVLNWTTLQCIKRVIKVI